MFSSLNEVAILVAAILAVAVESIWYSPLLLGSVWKKVAGLTQYTEDVSTRHMVQSTVWSVLVYIVLFTSATYIVRLMSSTQTLLQSEGILFILLIASLVLVAGREFRPWTYVAIHAGFIAITLFGGLGVIIYWPW